MNEQTSQKDYQQILLVVTPYEKLFFIKYLKTDFE